VLTQRLQHADIHRAPPRPPRRFGGAAGVAGLGRIAQGAFGLAVGAAAPGVEAGIGTRWRLVRRTVVVGGRRGGVGDTGRGTGRLGSAWA
jgi:hypothetical protein